MIGCVFVKSRGRAARRMGGLIQVFSLHPPRSSLIFLSGYCRNIELTAEVTEDSQRVAEESKSGPR